MQRDRYEDDLSDLLGEEPPAYQTNPMAAPRTTGFEENCPKCNGSGEFRSNVTGRRVGDCFACKGTGKKSFKTSPERRAAQRDYTVNAANRRADEREAEAAQWATEHKDEIAYLEAVSQNPDPNFDFPAKMSEALRRYGSLTDAQLAAVRRCMARAGRTAAMDQRKIDAPSVDISQIQAAFDHAKRRELERKPEAMGVWTRPLHLRADDLDLIVKPGSEGSQWEGQLFIKSGDRKLGNIKNGKFVRRFECSQVEADAIVKACQDPHAAAVAYAQAWSKCGVCGQTLTNAESIREGVGPICREKYGW